MAPSKPKKYNVKGDLVTGKENFLKVFNRIYRKELNELRKQSGDSDAKLSKIEISRLRNHPDLGFWSSNGKPISIESVNAHIRWLENPSLDKPKNSPLKFKVVTPKVDSRGYTRGFLESQKSITKEAQNWINRLDGKDYYDPKQRKIVKGTGIKLWPPGVTAKNILNDVGKAAEQVGAENQRLKELTGIDFQKGHGWGVMGMKGSRTWVVPYYGARMEGHFNFRNVAPQPDSPSLTQFLDPFWNSIIPNVPSKYSKYGVQISSAEDLRWAGGGGQGWSGTIADILLSKIPDANIDDFDKLPLDQKAYVLFGDPDKGGGANPEARYFEIKNGQWPNVLNRLKVFAATSVKESGEARILKPYSEEWNRAWDQILTKGSDTYNSLKTNTSAFISEIFPPTEGGGIKAQGDGTAVAVNQSVFPRGVNINKLADLGRKTLTKQAVSAFSPKNVGFETALNPNLTKQIGARIHKGEPIDWKYFGGELGKGLTRDAIFGGTTAMLLKKAGPLGLAFLAKGVFDATDAYVEGATGTSIRDRDAQRRIDQAPFSDKRIEESGLIPKYIQPDTESGVAEIKPLTPQVPNLKYIK